MCGPSTDWSSLLRKICYLLNPRRRPILFFFSSLPPFISCFIFPSKISAGLSRRLKGGSRIYLCRKHDIPDTPGPGLPTCFTLTVKIRFSALLATSRASDAGRQCIIFPLARQIGSHGFDLELRTLDIAAQNLQHPRPVPTISLWNIQKGVPQCPIERGSV